ncbi:MAG: hypothetical protein AAGA56_14125 [Myxococcota bacterium]
MFDFILIGVVAMGGAAAGAGVTLAHRARAMRHQERDHAEALRQRTQELRMWKQRHDRAVAATSSPPLNTSRAFTQADLGTIVRELMGFARIDGACVADRRGLLRATSGGTTTRRLAALAPLIEVSFGLDAPSELYLCIGAAGTVRMRRLGDHWCIAYAHDRDVTTSVFDIAYQQLGLPRTSPPPAPTDGPPSHIEGPLGPTLGDLLRSTGATWLASERGGELSTAGRGSTEIKAIATDFARWQRFARHAAHFADSPLIRLEGQRPDGTTLSFSPRAALLASGARALDELAERRIVGRLRRPDASFALETTLELSS